MRQNLIGTLNGDIQPFLQPSQALGQALLYCSTTIFNFKLWNILPTPEGRFIITDIDTVDKIMTLVNVYVPNEDNPAVFGNVRDKLCYFECDFVVFGGDFNLVCNVSKDKKGGVATTHLKSKDEVEAISEDFELADISA